MRPLLLRQDVVFNGIRYRANLLEHVFAVNLPMATHSTRREKVAISASSSKQIHRREGNLDSRRKQFAHARGPFGTGRLRPRHSCPMLHHRELTGFKIPDSRPLNAH